MATSDLKTQFEQLLQRNRGRLAAIARTYAERDADDLWQQILLQILSSLPGFQQRSSLETWCYRVALNTAISWRRRNRSRRINLAAEPADLEQVAGTQDGHDPVQLLQRFIRTLRDADQAFVLMYLADLSGSEMAEILGLSESAVRQRVHRIKCRLAEWNAGDT